ncbi:MAG: tetratricopeptide repeat protein [Cyanobacteria bacterium J06559_3]
MRSLLAVGLSVTTFVVAPPAIVQTQSVEDLYRQGIAAHNAGDYTQAEAIWQQVLEVNPDDAVAHYNLGTALAAQGQYEAAETAHREAIRLDPSYAIYCPQQPGNCAGRARSI